jgi:dipeptidyl aminopeptidase/acylaminoacyl peptidase
MRFLAGLGLALAVAWPSAAAPLAAYGGLPSIESVEISPDGSKLAVVLTRGDQRIIGVKTLPEGETQTFAVGPAKIRRLDWVGGDDLIITASKTAAIVGVEAADRATAVRREYFMGFQLNLATHKLQPLLDGVLSRAAQTGTHLRDPNATLGATLNILAGEPEVRMVKGKPTLFLRSLTFPDGWASLTVFQMNLKTRYPELVELGDRQTEDIVLSQDGVAIAKSQYDPDTGAWSLRLRQGSGWAVSRSGVAKGRPPELLGLGRDGQSVLVREPDERGASLREVTGAGWGEPLEVHDSSGLIFDPATHRLIGHHDLVGDEDRYVFFDPQDQGAWNAVLAAFKGQRVHLESWSQDRRKIVVLVDSPMEGPAYALVDVAAKQASWLGGRYQDLAPEDIAPVQPIRFKAKDGLELTGYLTLPRAAEAKNLPLIVFPHGGPASRDTPGFDWWAQAMASRGYAVLQVNFRGSEGFGGSFLEAGFGQWGRKMQTDLSDGVRFLAAQGTVDPKRVCIVGASYGGYAALAGAALDTGVYRCAASVSGPADLQRFVAWSKGQNGVSAQRYWTRFMGAEAADDPALREISPAAHADRVTIPVLLVHGRDDTVVPLEQSQVMADALKAAGKPFELVVQKGEDHWLSRGETRLQTLEATMAFVEKHNPPK